MLNCKPKWLKCKAPWKIQNWAKEGLGWLLRNRWIRRNRFPLLYHYPHLNIQTTKTMVRQGTKWGQTQKREKKKSWYTDKIKDCFLSRVCFGVFIFKRWIFLLTKISGLFYSDFKLNQVYIWRLTFDCKKVHPKALNKKSSNYSWQFLVKCSFIIAREYEKEHAEHQTQIYFNTPILENIPVLFRLNSDSMVQQLCYAFCSELKSIFSFGS